MASDVVSNPCNISIKSLKFSDNTTIDFSAEDSVLIVGPNNSGKSLALKEINSAFTNNREVPNRCILEISRRYTGTNAELLAFMEVSATLSPDGKDFYSGTTKVNKSLVSSFGKSVGDKLLGVLFVSYLDAQSRLNICGPTQNVDPLKQLKSHPLHHVYDNEFLLNSVNEKLEEAFGEKIVIDYRAGSYVGAHFGINPKLETEEQVISDRYVNLVRELPRLQEQGDGVKSFTGIVLHTLTDSKPITLIDEPEAFLHPPQMRLLGKFLASAVKTQMFIATHSSDILRGFVDSNAENLRIIRLKRDGKINIPIEAPAELLKNLWIRPELKYSNALEALFHERCILVESDSDCRFYNWISDHLVSNADKKQPDTLYIPCGGKHIMSQLSAILEALAVPTLLVFDIDIMANKDDLKKAIESKNADWNSFSSDHSIINANISQKSLPTPDEIRDSVISLLNDTRGKNLPKGEVESLLRSNKPWQIVKKFGKDAIPAGDATKAFNRLSKNLENIGIYVVPKGEIENLVQEEGSHGPKWVNKVIEKYTPASDELKHAREFVQNFYCGPQNG